MGGRDLRRALLAGGAALIRQLGALRDRYYPILLLSAAVVFSLDHLTKWLVTNHLAVGEQVPSSGLVVIRHVENRGAAFGLFPNLQLFFLIVAVGVAFYILFFGQRFGTTVFRECVLGAVLGGAIGNAVDRLSQGYVVDFIDPARVPVVNFKYATFNVADMAIVVGIITALLTFRAPSRAG